MELIKPNIYDLNWEILLSVVLALLCGMILGLEREINNKWAGLRTHMLVCLGSCIFTVLSIYGFPIFVDPTNIHSSRFGDPTRIAAQILTGIGFIGGGTVLRHGTSVFGLTTAATLWISAAIGMICACKMYYLATLVTVVVVAILVLIRLVEKKLFHFNHPKCFEVKLCVDSNEAETIHNKISEQFNINAIQKKDSKQNENCVEITATIQLNERNPVEKLYKEISSINQIQEISVRELNEKEKEKE